MLQRKPGALPGATALAQARGDGTFTAAHDFWALARSGCGDAGGTRALVEVLLLHRHLGHADVVAGLAAAVSVGSASPDVVAVEARKATQARGVTVPTSGSRPAAVDRARQHDAAGDAYRICLVRAVTLVASAVWGSEWFSRGDGFEVYSGLLGRLCFLGRGLDGRLALRNPLAGVAATRAPPGLFAVVGTLLGSTAYDSLSNAPAGSTGSPGARCHRDWRERWDCSARSSR